jgi:hypothetical protein
MTNNGFPHDEWHHGIRHAGIPQLHFPLPLTSAKQNHSGDKPDA